MPDSPILFIGIGGAGGQICSRINKQAQCDFAVNRRKTRAVYLDTDSVYMADSHFTEIFDERIHLYETPKVYSFIYKERQRIESWFPCQVDFLHCAYPEIQNLRLIVRLAFEHAILDGRMKPLEKQIEDLFGREWDSHTKNIRIKIVSSLAGTAGSALLLPLSLYLRRYIEGRFPGRSLHLEADLLLPQMENESADGPETVFNYAKTYAAMLEVNAFMKQWYGTLDSKYSDGLELMLPKPFGKEGYRYLPFDTVLLFPDHIDYLSVFPETVFQKCADTLFDLNLSAASQKIYEYEVYSSLGSRLSLGKRPYSCVKTKRIRFQIKEFAQYLSLIQAQSFFDGVSQCENVYRTSVNSRTQAAEAKNIDNKEDVENGEAFHFGNFAGHVFDENSWASGEAASAIRAAHEEMNKMQRLAWESASTASDFESWKNKLLSFSIIGVSEGHSSKQNLKGETSEISNLDKMLQALNRGVSDCADEVLRGNNNHENSKNRKQRTDTQTLNSRFVQENGSFHSLIWIYSYLSELERLIEDNNLKYERSELNQVLKGVKQEKLIQSGTVSHNGLKKIGRIDTENTSGNNLQVDLNTLLKQLYHHWQSNIEQAILKKGSQQLVSSISQEKQAVQNLILKLKPLHYLLEKKAEGLHSKWTGDSEVSEAQTFESNAWNTLLSGSSTSDLIAVNQADFVPLRSINDVSYSQKHLRPFLLLDEVYCGKQTSKPVTEQMTEIWNLLGKALSFAGLASDDQLQALIKTEITPFACKFAENIHVQSFLEEQVERMLIEIFSSKDFALPVLRFIEEAVDEVLEGLESQKGSPELSVHCFLNPEWIRIFKLNMEKMAELSKKVIFVVDPEIKLDDILLTATVRNMNLRGLITLLPANSITGEQLFQDYKEAYKNIIVQERTNSEMAAWLCPHIDQRWQEKDSLPSLMEDLHEDRETFEPNDFLPDLPIY